MMRLLVSTLLACAAAGAAAAPPLTPGTYYEQFPNKLDIRRTADGRTMFVIAAGNARAAVCDLDGEIKDGKARMPDSSLANEPCVVSFAARDGGIDVSSSVGCQTYCGNGASFDAIYRPRPRECEPTGIQATRNRFKVAYDQKRYEEARDVLRAMTAQCGTFISERDSAWIANDLALTYHHLGDRSACLAALKPVENYANAEPVPAEELAELKRSDPLRYDSARLEAATRTNLALCRRGVGR